MTEHWERCKKYLEPALEKGYTIDDVRNEIEAERARFWPLPNSAVVTQILTLPRQKVLRIWLAGGNLDELLWAFGRMAEEYARDRGCTAIEIDGRKGWAKVLEGFEAKRVVLTKELT